MCGLQFSGWVGEQEGAPIGDAAHDAALVEDDFACGFGDSRDYESDMRFGRRRLRTKAMEGGITLSLRRGGQAGPAVVSRHSCGNATQTYHSNHLIQHLDLLRRGVAVPLLPSRKVFECGQPFRGRAPPPKSWHMLSSRCNSPTKLHNLTRNNTKMASRTSFVRAARQLTSTAARRPSPLVCQRWAQASQKPRLFSVSAACMFIYVGNSN